MDELQANKWGERRQTEIFFFKVTAGRAPWPYMYAVHDDAGRAQGPRTMWAAHVTARGADRFSRAFFILKQA